MKDSYMSYKSYIGQNSGSFGSNIRSCSIATRHSTLSTRSGFTMIEIAISLAVIGFALVAIIGILPQGMNVQKENRQETIINQDANMFLEALRNGGRGFDDLTNYVVAVTNAWAIYGAAGTIVNSGVDGYTYASAFVNNAPSGDLITNGLRIVGLLTTPRYIDLAGSNGPVSFRSNYVVAYVRSMSGQAGEKFPQTNSMMREMAFGYKMMPEIAAYCYFEPDWTNYAAYLTSVNTNEWIMRSNYFRLASTVQTNLYDLRLTFRWPLFPNGNVGNERQIFRTVAGGRLWQTNDLPNNSGMPVWFFEPRTYVKANIP